MALQRFAVTFTDDPDAVPVVVTVTAWDTIDAEQRCADAGAEPQTRPLMFAYSLGYAALMRTWHGPKRAEWESFDDVMARAVFTDPDETEAAGPTGPGPSSDAP